MTVPSRIKFTAEVVRKFHCSPGANESLLWDEGEKTLCIRARRSGKKSYYFQSRYSSKVLKIKIGNLSDINMTYQAARIIARRYQSQIDAGEDPRRVKQDIIEKRVEELSLQLRESITVGELWDRYVSANSVYL